MRGVLRGLGGTYLLFRKTYCACRRLLYPEGRLSAFKTMVSVLPTARHHIPRNSDFMVTTLTT